MVSTRTNRFFTATGYLSAEISSIGTSITPTLVTGALPSYPPYYLTLGDSTARYEVVKVTADSSGTLTITRAQGSTSASAHPQGESVVFGPNDADLNDLVETWTRSASGALSFAGAVNVTGALDLDGSTIGFYGATPVAKAGGTADIKDSLVALGLITDGGATPLNLDAGAATVGAVTIAGALDHDGTTVGFYGATPATRPTAYTQTYATADKTLSAYTPDSESSVYTGAADTEAKLVDLNALRVAYENLRAFAEDLAQHHNSVVDDLQTLGLLQ